MSLRRWYTETSGQGMAGKYLFIVNPPQAKKETDIYDKVEAWLTELKIIELSEVKRL